MEENKGKSHKGFKLFVLLLLIGVLFFINEDNRGNFLNAYKSLTIREKSLEDISRIELDSSDKVGFYDKNIALWGNNKLSFIDKDDNLLFEKQFNFASPQLVFGQDRIYVMDKSSGDVYILDRHGETVERLVLENSINNLIESKDTMLIHTKSEDQESLIILDTNGVFFRIHPIENMDILTYDVDKENQAYLISNLVIDNEIRSEILIYSLSGDLVDRIDISNEIVIFTEFLSGDLIVLTDRSLYYIKDSKIFWKKTFSDIKDILLQDDEIYVLYGDNLELIDLDGRTINKFSFTNNYDTIKNFDKKILIYGDNNIVGVQGDKVIIDYKHDNDIKDVIINKNFLGLVDYNSLQLFKLINK